jgi:hypothetical protein
MTPGIGMAQKDFGHGPSRIESPAWSSRSWPSVGPVRRTLAVVSPMSGSVSFRSLRFSVMFAETLKMSSRAKSSLVSHRARMARRGFVRVEVNVRKDDASLVRRVAAALIDPARQAAARRLLRQRFAEPPKVSLKTLLASAPLDGIDLDRGPDFGRDVDL